MPTMLWLWIWAGPALLGLFARLPWMSALLIIVNALVFTLHLREPNLALVALAALYPIALALVVIGRRRARAIGSNAERLLSEVQRLNDRRSDW
jgi:membrane protein implicated in regulation of membrane protease activity